MTKQFTVIRFTQVVTEKRGRRVIRRFTRSVWVSGVRFADGPGYQVKSVSFTTDRDKANRFSLVAAHQIAEQYYTSPATLERPDGTPMPEETAALLNVCIEKNRARIQHQAEIRAEWNQFWFDMPADLKMAIAKLGVRL